MSQDSYVKEIYNNLAVAYRLVKLCFLFALSIKVHTGKFV